MLISKIFLTLSIALVVAFIMLVFKKYVFKSQSWNEFFKLKPIRIVFIILIIIVVIFIIKSIKKYHESTLSTVNDFSISSSNSNSIQNDSNTINENKEYITEDSNVSPTGKEFIGVFSENLINSTSQGDYTKIKYYQTTVTNLKTFSNRSWVDNLVTGNKDEVMGNDYYYNSTNNHIIGQRFWTSDKFQLFTTMEQNYNTSMEDFININFKANFNVFFNFHNDNQSPEILDKYEKYNNYLNTINNVNKKEFSYKNYEFIYWNIGDILYVLTNYKHNEKRFESLNLAYDENQLPEDVIKNWYDTVDILTEQQEQKSKVEIGVTYQCITESTVGFIKFDDETNFTMEIGDVGSEKFTMNGNYTINDNKITLNVTYDSYYYYGDVAPDEVVMEPYTEEVIILDDGTLKYNDAIIYDKNVSNNTITADNTNYENTSPYSLLDEIYNKYPNYKNKEGFICTDGENYWLLDSSGEKIYFHDLNSFEQAQALVITSN